MSAIREPGTERAALKPPANDPMRQHSGDDWADLKIGPNRTTNGGPIELTPRVAIKPAFIIEPEVAQRFNAYAEAAYPREIGGLLRIEEGAQGPRAVELRVFPHLVAHSTYFELDGEEVAKFNMELVEAGRAAEISQWRSLIHSHPNMEPFLSGTDQTNLIRLAGTGHAYSVICSTRGRPEGNYFAVHYGQGGPMKLVVRDWQRPAQDALCKGTALLDEAEKQEIAEQVKAYLPAGRSSYSGYGWGMGV